MATEKAAHKVVTGAPPVGATCHICRKPAAASVTFQSPTGQMRSLWLCRNCFRDSWGMLTTTEGK